MKTIKELREAIENEKARSAWGKAVKLYALELIEEMDDGAEFYGSPADKRTCSTARQIGTSTAGADAL